MLREWLAASNAKREMLAPDILRGGAYAGGGLAGLGALGAGAYGVHEATREPTLMERLGLG